MRPKPFFDTQLPEMAASGAIPARDWELVQEYFESEADYHISPLTVTEILDRVNKDTTGKYFSRIKEQIQRLYPSGKHKKFFDFIRYFVTETLFGTKMPRPFTLEKDFAFNLELVLWAENRGALATGVPMPFLTEGKYILRLDRFSLEIDTIRNRFKSYLAQLKGRKKFSLTPEEWLNDALKFINVDSVENRRRFIENLHAAFQFECWILDAARNHNYSLDKNISDQIDAQQLYYLCDPAVVFITNDTDHEKRLRGNPQRNRIKTFSEILDLVKRGNPLI
jgi:hypothetical protein